MTMSIAEALSVLPSGEKPSAVMTPEEIGKYLRTHYACESELKRRERHARRNNLFADGGCEYMREVIDRVFQDPTVKELRKQWVEHARFSNSLKRIVGEVSTVYSEPASRRVGGDEANEKAYASLVEAVMLDEVMGYGNRMLNLHRAIALGPRVRIESDFELPIEKRHRSMAIDVVTPDNAIAVCDPNDASHVIMWAIRVEYRSGRVPDGWRCPAWQLWNAKEKWFLDKDLMPIGQPVAHGLVDEDGRGVMPWVGITYHAEAVPGFWPGEEGEDLVAAQVAIWMANILLLKETKSATKQNVVSGDMSTAARGQASDTETTISAPEGTTIQTVDMGMDTSTFTDAADHALERVGNNYGLSMAQLQHQGTQSAEARELMLEPLRFLRRTQIKTFRRVERALCQLMAIVAKADAPKLAFTVDEFGVDFGEPQVLLSETERLNVFEKKQALGLDNIIDYLMRENPDADQRQALLALVRNFTISTVRVSLMKDMMAMSGELGAAAARADSGETTNGGRPIEAPPGPAANIIAPTDGEQDLSWIEEALNAA